MLRPGRYKSEHDGNVFQVYRYIMEVKETAKSYIFKLLEVENRYADDHIEIMFGGKKRIVLPKDIPFIFSGLIRRRASVWRCFPEISATECGTTCASINFGNPGHWSLQSLRPYLIRLRFVNSFFSRSRNTKCFALAASSQSRKKSEALGNSLLSLLREYVSASYS